MGEWLPQSVAFERPAGHSLPLRRRGRLLLRALREAQRGPQAIAEDWIARKDEPDDWTFEFDVVATSGDLAFVRGLTTYKEPPRIYHNLWMIRMDQTGKCTEFTEWWMETDKPTPSTT